MDSHGLFNDEEDYALSQWRRNRKREDDALLYACPEPRRITREEFMRQYGDEISSVFNALKTYLYNTGVTLLDRMTVHDLAEFVWKLHTTRR